MTTLEKLEKLVYHDFKETNRRSKKTDLQIKRNTRRRKGRRLELKKTARHLKEARHALDKATQHGKETAILLKEIAQIQKETDKALKQLSKDISDFTDPFDRFAESAVYPAVAKLFCERGIKLTDTYWRIGDRSNGYQMEVDVLGIGPKHAVLIEVKLKLKLEHVKELLEKLDKFFDVFTYFKGRTLYGAVAGLTVDKGVDRFAYKHGLFVMAQTGDNLRIMNDPTFVPHKF